MAEPFAKNPRERSWRSYIHLSIDERSLAALRIGLGACLLADLATRARNLEALYTDAGVLPRAMLDPWMRQSVANLHLLGGSAEWQLALFAVATLAAVCMVIGWHTRIATVVSWWLLASLQLRNVLVLNLGDDIFRMAMFWSMFLPLGRRCSLDARRRPASGSPEVLTPGTAGLLLQIAFIYFFTGLLKSGPDWWNGTAVHYALSLDHIAKPLARPLRDLPGLISVATYGTLVLELSSPFLLLAPRVLLRSLGAICLASLHVGILLSFRLGVFQWVDLALLLVFVPGRAWDALGLRATTHPPPRKRRADPPDWARAAFPVLVALLLTYLAIYNVDSVRPLSLPSWFTAPGAWLRINQQWRMFSPQPKHRDRWLVIPGELANGQVVDLSPHGPELAWTKPDRVWGSAPTRFFIYLHSAASPNNHMVRLRLAQWHCEQWKRTHDSGPILLRVKIDGVYEDTLAPGKGERIEHERLITYDCRTGEVEWPAGFDPSRQPSGRRTP